LEAATAVEIQAGKDAREADKERKRKVKELRAKQKQN
jgi:hypothetical protein